ncbi:hypothetical protein HMPREF2541_01680 [Eikenella sp. HMSC061C02]|nr:hypothetical protein A7P84_06055 [Eikenella corrodens]OAM19344.1 hypothetical protein A7P84_06110 [Eikenella corrodens]OFN59502.1 hypothetical protein HMPREF2541_01680 [Eikenella sp. HMSC061C02]
MTNLRINDTEKELIRKVSIDTNRKLVNLGKMPLKESELVHVILQKALKRTQIDEEGNIEIV